MKKSTMSIALATALLSMTAVNASEFKGGYVGGKLGFNTNSPVVTNVTSNKFYLGGEIGYGWDLNKFMLGVDGFVDGHNKSVTGKDYGADVKLGFPMDKLMPYAKLGFAASHPGARVHGGFGVEYKYAPHWSVAGEWTADSKNVNSVKEKNSNVSVGVNYYFN
jgi:outer membrane immunogenic protein